MYFQLINTMRVHNHVVYPYINTTQG